MEVAANSAVNVKGPGYSNAEHCRELGNHVAPVHAEAFFMR